MDIRKEILEKLNEIVSSLEVENIPIEVEIPSNRSFGDYSTNIAMKLTKVLGKNPIDIANEIKEKFKNIENIEKIEVVKPGFINFYLSQDLILENLKEIISKKDDYGKTDFGKGKKWLIEHTSANPNKAMHFGHLRNNVTGMVISNLWENIGIEVIRDYIDNNRGIAIAKLMWGYLKFAKKNESAPTDINYWHEHKDEWHTPEELGIKSDHFVDKLYNQASEDFKNPEVEEKVRQMVIDWENEDPINWELWELVLKYSHEGQQETLQRLGSKIDKIWYEHEIYKKGKEIVETGLEKGIFQKLEDGAILTNLKEYKIPDTVVLKRDGTSLYITQDLALTKLKRETFNPDKLFWVVGPDQSLALKQVFAVCEQLGFGKFEDYTHLSFGYVTIKGQGKMSSRKGNVVYIDDLLDGAKATIKDKIKNEDLSEEEKDQIAEILGIGAVKYSILKVGRMTDTAFDFNTSLSFEGDSGPYLVYTYARCKAILRQSQEVNHNTALVLNESTEIEILKLLNRYKDIVLEAALSYAPNILANYLYDLAQKYNSFYNSLSVLNAESEEIKNSRLMLTQATAQVLKNGLNLLGIETVEKM